MSCCCKGGSGDNKLTSPRLAKVFYLFIMIVSVVVGLLLRYYGGDMFVSLSSFKVGCAGKWQDRCFGDQAVYRISFALLVFFMLMLLGSMSDAFNRGYWGLKLGLYAIMTVVAFFIPNDFFNTYADISRVVSIIFLLLMVVILIDFAYTLQETWEERASDVEAEAERDGYETPGVCANPWRLGYLAVVFVLVVVALAGLIGMYAYNAPAACSGNMGFLSLTLIVGLVFMVGSPLECAGGKGLLPPAVVWCYCVWLIWSAETSNPDTVCNPVKTGSSPAQIALGLAITALSLAYTAWSAANSVGGLFASDDETSEASAGLLTNESGARAIVTGDAEGTEALEAARDKAADDSDADPEAGRAAASATPAADDEADAGRGSWVFHVIMMTASLYMAMLLTDWGASTGDVTTSGVSHTTMWVKILSQWCTMLLYGWTLIAGQCGPRICPGRDFS